MSKMMPWRRVATDPPADLILTVQASGFFDPVWYLHRYPDIARFRRGPLVHFCMYGLRELRMPSATVSPANYLRRFPQARTSTLPAFLEALTTLAEEERSEAWMPDDDESLGFLLQRHGVFDEAWYIERNPDVALSGLRPLDHFLQHGAAECRDPGPAFDTSFYRDSHQDYADLCRTPIEHFIRIGRGRGDAGVGPPRYQRWLTAFDLLTPDDLDRIRADVGLSSISVAACHVLDAAACARMGEIAEGWAGLIGLGPLCFVRCADVAEETWRSCATMLASWPTLSADEAGAWIVTLPADTLLLLCAGPTLLRPHAAHVLARTIGEAGADAAYADHDHRDPEGLRSAPVFKPAMSPEFMRRLPYAGALVGVRLGDAHRARLATAVTAAAKGFGEAAWADVLLALPPAKVARAPFLLSHRLEAPSPGPTVYEPVPSSTSVPEVVRVADSADWPTVSIIIPTRDRSELLQACIDSILAETDYPPARFTITVVDNGSVEPATRSYFAELTATSVASIVASPGPFNFARICNDGAHAATGDVLVFLNNDMTVNRRDWLLKLVAFARRPDIGIVGAQLLYPDDMVQHGGVVLGVKGVGAHRLAGLDAERAARIDVTREMVSVTGACLAVRRDLFRGIGGFDPRLQVAFNDVSLCASAHEAGYRNIYIAEPLLYHHESKSRGFDDSRAKQHRNAREAIYARERHGALFRDDPSYSPNLSLQKVGDLGTPPRVVRPWRRSRPGQRRLLLLSRVNNIGDGVATVLEQQARFFLDRGWEVIVGGPVRRRDIDYVGCSRADLWTAEAAAAFAVAEGVDAIIAHTPPFFSTTRYLGARPPMYVFDHGEPHPRLFPNWQEREDIDWEKRFCAPLAKRVFTISETIARHQYRRDAIVVRNGNSHLATWSESWAERRTNLRKALGFEGSFVVLNVCRFGAGERYYKGIGRYAEVAADAPFRHPELGDRVRFVLAGRGSEDDIADVRAMGLRPFANISNAEMTELYVASDLYLNLSEWEGYNLGIGQALAMGLDVIASDIEAHREFGVDTFTGVPDICAALARRVAAWDEASNVRRPAIDPWDKPLRQLATILEADVDDVASCWL